MPCAPVKIIIIKKSCLGQDHFKNSPNLFCKPTQFKASMPGVTYLMCVFIALTFTSVPCIFFTLFLTGQWEKFVWVHSATLPSLLLQRCSGPGNVCGDQHQSGNSECWVMQTSYTCIQLAMWFWLRLKPSCMWQGCICLTVSGVALFLLGCLLHYHCMDGFSSQLRAWWSWRGTT